jgi:hypothetical protein
VLRGLYRRARAIASRLWRVERDDEKLEFEERQFGRAWRDDTVFDRVAYAMRALDMLKPKHLKVVVYQRIDDMHIEQGRELRDGPNARWAVVGIPPHASREHIAVGLARLAGVAHIPYMIDVLVRM